MPTLPLALTASAFPLRALAHHAARASLGGPRELLLGVLQAARLVDGAVGPYALPDPLRRARATAARTWLAALVIPAPARQTLLRCFDASAGDDRGALAGAWAAVAQLAGPALDGAGRNELRLLALLLPPVP